MDAIGIFSPEQARELWQDYLARKQLPAQLTKAFPQRRPIDEPSPHRAFVYNTTSETIPPYACLRVIGTRDINSVTAIDVEKPTSLIGEFLFNGPYSIDPAGNAVAATYDTPALPARSGVGWAYKFGVVVMLGDEPSEPGVQYSPIIDSWEIEESGGPFVVYGRHRTAEDEYTNRGLIGRIGGSTSGGAPRIWFIIDEVECFSDGSKVLQVYPTWYTGGCTTAIPGEDSYGRLEIIDVCSTLYPYTAEQLLDATGSATQMYPRSGYCEPKWIVDDICVIPDCA